MLTFYHTIKRHNRYIQSNTKYPNFRHYHHSRVIAQSFDDDVSLFVLLYYDHCIPFLSLPLWPDCRSITLDIVALCLLLFKCSCNHGRD